MITALNRPHELKLHVRGAINNGLTKEEIAEVFSKRQSIVEFLLPSIASESQGSLQGDGDLNGT